MNFKLLKIGLLVAALGLASCGGDSGTTSSTTGTTAATTVVAANTGTVTVTTAPNNVVSIGASGTNFKTADATGKAVFTGLPAGAVDVHIFSADGYTAASYMGYTAASLVDTTGISTSVIDVYVQVVNPDVSGQSFYLLVGSDRYFASQNTITGIVSFTVNGNVGSVVAGTVYAAQGLATSSAGNAASGHAEVLNLGTHSFITTATTGTAQVNLVANFAATLPVAPVLATIQSVTPPAGMTVESAQFGYATVSGAPLVQPDTISAGMIGNDWNVVATDGTGNVWFYLGTFVQGDTLTATATLSIPTIAANQTGNTISWINNSSTQSLNIVDIYDAGFNYDWQIYIPNNIASVTLPTVPTGITSPLSVGTTYLVDVFSFKEVTGAAYEQTITLINTSVNLIGEVVGTSGVSYTR